MRETMKYKLLLAGKNKTVIDDIFAILGVGDDLEFVTTSMRPEDIHSHIRFYQPDAFCYCISNETSDNLHSMVPLKRKLEKELISLIVVGTEDECADFERMLPNIADIIIPKPSSISIVGQAVTKHLKERREEEERKRQEEEEKRRQEEEKRAEEERKRQEEEEKQRREKDKNRRKHILIIDDDSGMLKTIKEQLHEQYDVATAISGKIALKFLEKKTTDLILLDYEMPIETGPEVLQKLREKEETKNIPVIFLTGMREKAKIAQVLSMKPQGYLLKPIEHDILITKIEGTLQGEYNE